MNGGHIGGHMKTHVDKLRTGSQHQTQLLHLKYSTYLLRVLIMIMVIIPLRKNTTTTEFTIENQ